MSNSNKTETIDQDTSVKEEPTFVSHLFELRDRLIRITILFLVCFITAFFFWQEVYTYLSGMIKTTVKKDGEIIELIKWINLSPAGGIFTAIKISMSTAFFITLPFIFFQLWKFIAPGLYQHERRLITPIIIGGTLLFYLGILFARYVILPIFFGFAETFIPPNTENQYDILKYLSFTLSIFFAFGIAFQVPVVTIVLVWGGISTPDKLIQKRPYVIVGSFVIGMLLTPPDMISQTLLAIPMWLLFELGIILSRIYYYKPKEDDEDNSIYDGPDDGPDDDPPSGGMQYNAASSDKSVNASGVGVSHAEGDLWKNRNKDNLENQNANESDDQSSDYEPLTDEQLDAEMDRFDAEMDELERQEDLRNSNSENEAEQDSVSEDESKSTELGSNDLKPEKADNEQADNDESETRTKSEESKPKDK